MIKYKKYQNKTEQSASYGKWYGRAVHELMEFDEFIEHMAKHHCVYSEGTLRGVLIEMEICLRELLLEGKAVRLLKGNRCGGKETSCADQLTIGIRRAMEHEG